MNKVLLHDAAIQHFAYVAALRAVGVGSKPLIFKIDYGLLPNARVGTSWARINRAVLKTEYLYLSYTKCQSSLRSFACSDL